MIYLNFILTVLCIILSLFLIGGYSIYKKFRKKTFNSSFKNDLQQPVDLLKQVMTDMKKTGIIK